MFALLPESKTNDTIYDDEKAEEETRLGAHPCTQCNCQDFCASSWNDTVCTCTHVMQDHVGMP